MHTNNYSHKSQVDESQISVKLDNIKSFHSAFARSMSQFATCFDKLLETILYFNAKGKPHFEHAETFAKRTGFNQSYVENVVSLIKKLGLIRVESNPSRKHEKWRYVDFEALKRFYGELGLNRFMPTKPMQATQEHINELAKSWLDYLKKEHGFTPSALQKQSERVNELISQGVDVASWINHAISQNWKSLHEPKPTKHHHAPYSQGKSYERSETPFERQRRIIQEKRARRRQQRE